MNAAFVVTGGRNGPRHARIPGHGAVTLIRKNARPHSHGCWSRRFHYFSATPSKVGNVSSAGICYDLILARPMPPPSVGKASFMRGHCDHRTNCSSTKHKEGLRYLLAIGGS